MLSLLLITALAVQYPPPAAKAATAPRGTSQSAVGRMAFHDRLRELWSDHVVYTRNFIVSATAGLPDTTDVSQRLLRNQDELGEAIKPYYGDAAASQLASLLRNHIQLAAKTLIAAKGTSTAMQPGMNMQDSAATSGQYVSSRMTTDTIKATGRMNDTTKARGQTSQVDSTSLNQAIADLKANGDSIAAFLSSANPRGFAREPLRSAIQMHITLLLKEATAQIKKDWSGSIAAFEESQRQAMQMADMLSDGIMKQFPSRFTNKATAVSLR